MELTRRLYESMWAALGGSGDLASVVSFAGGEVLPGPFAVSHVGAASFAAVGAAMADLVSTVTGEPPAVQVDRTLASVWLAHWSAPVGWDRGTPWHGVSTDYPTADGRWVRLQANYHHLRRAAAKALGATEDREAFARAIAAMTADEAEHTIVTGGGAAAATRTLDEWAAHPQGQAVAAEPLIDTTFGDGAVNDGILAGWAPTPQRPLAGIRVLDITRVLAGPVGTRTLAGYGAEVLRIDPPGFLEPDGSAGGGDLMLGKRCVYLDISTPAGRDTFLSLLSEADILVHGLRPGALDGLGLGADVRRAAAPGVIEVTLNAYGWTGPWQGRRGFDTLVQTSSGMSTELMRRGGLPGPKLLPSQVLDFATGYLIAAAAIRGLAERARHGRWSSWRLALARTGVLLRGAGEAPEEAALGEPADSWYEDRVYNFPKGPVRRLAWPTSVERAPLFWERAGDPYGTATPIWATAQSAARTTVLSRLSRAAIVPGHRARRSTIVMCVTLTGQPGRPGYRCGLSRRRSSRTDGCLSSARRRRRRCSNFPAGNPSRARASGRLSPASSAWSRSACGCG
jgi:crotonobetainyl-CoA:carnitine CoA-transferase CaiB-like acyl-CoA transferase